MKKYSYKYCVYFNNCGMGVQFVKAFNRLIDALNYKEDLQRRAGCCDVVKKRFYNGAEKPANIYIANNYKYHDYDLYI
jgi:hypothetical protein